jgi:pimeloyl-ACP methyl ester carboxylesterase
MALRPIVFSHANGFPAGTYRRLFEAWRAAGHPVHAIDKLGHDPRWPVTSNWPHVRDELLAFADAVVPGQRVHLVGHSLGGFLSLLAACRRPALAASVLLIDSPVVAGWRAHSLQVAKATRLFERVSPGKVSQVRRHRWPSVDEVRRHWGAKHVFARWAPGVLDDYIAAGTEPDEAPAVAAGAADAAACGVRLAFRREVETRFYNTLPHHLGQVLRRHPPACPVGFIGGTQSAEVRQAGLAATRAVTQGRMAWIEGSHLFPMERPEETAALVLRCLRAMERPTPTGRAGDLAPTEGAERTESPWAAGLAASAGPKS